MNVKFFNEEDFFSVSDEALQVHAYHAAEEANRLLSERGAVVRGFTGNGFLPAMWTSMADELSRIPNTHTALLINIQPIQKEDPDSWEKIGRELIEWKEWDEKPSLKDLKERARKLAGVK